MLLDRIQDYARYTDEKRIAPYILCQLKNKNKTEKKNNSLGLLREARWCPNSCHKGLVSNPSLHSGAVCYVKRLSTE